MMFQPINPYVAGSPLRGKKGFFGRQDTMEWVGQELRNSTTNALVLYGQRRIGKTTLLLQLRRTLPSNTFLPVYFDLHDQAMRPLHLVLVELVAAIASQTDWEPTLDSMDNQGHLFRRTFLPQLYEVLGENRRLAFLLDEFDVLDQVAVEESSKLAAKTLFPFLRRVMNEDPRLAFVFVVGRHAEDLSLDFTSTFKASLAREIRVLDRASAQSLVRQAETNDTLNYTDQAVERILYLTCCHPYMTQLLCQRIWEQAYKESPAAIPRIDAQKVDVAIPDALEAGKHALIWLWDGLSPAEKIYTSALAEIADEEKEIIPENQVTQVLEAHVVRLRMHELEHAPRHLVKRRVLEPCGEQEYRFAVELFRRWVREYRPLRDVEKQVNPLAEQIFGVGQRIFYQGRRTAAIRYFRDALETDSHHFRARLCLGDALLELGQVDEAVTELKQAYEINSEESRSPLARALAAQAKMRKEAGDEDGALAACENALQISPREQAAQEMKTNIWIQRGNAAMERSELDKALAAYRQAGAEQWEDAVDLVQDALEKDPTLFRARLHLSEILLELGRPDKAMTELDVALDAYQQAGVEPGKEAIDFFQRILETNPHYFFAQPYLSLVLLKHGQIDKMVTDLEQAYKLYPAEARLPLARALVAQAQAARETGNWVEVLNSCTRAVTIEHTHLEALEMASKATAELQRTSAASAPSFQDAQEKPTLARTALSINKHELSEILSTAQNHVRLLGVVALDADWQAWAEKLAAKLANNSDFEITILCESDNMLFSKSLTCNTAVAEKRRSFQELQFIRDRAIIDFPEFLFDRGAPEENIEVKIMHLPLPISIVQVDSRIFASLWLHEIEDHFEEITHNHPWHSPVKKYVSTYFDPTRGRKYASEPKDPRDEVLELFDHKRIPRGIYPRNSFYDTDYSQLVVWAFVFDRRGRLLIHRRSDNAKDNRGMWDKSVGGHTDLADLDTSRAVPREVIEELFSDEIRESQTDFTVWAVSDRDMIYLGEWRPDQRQRHPFREIRALDCEWVFFRLRDSQQLYSPRTLPDGTVRRLRVIADVFLFVAGPQLTDLSLGELKNSVFKLVELAELKDAMDRGIRGDEVPGFDNNRPVPKFTPDLTNIMTGKLRDTLEEFSQYIKAYIR